MQTKNILLVDQFNKIGGGQSMLIYICQALAAGKANLSLLVPSGKFLESSISQAKFYYYPTTNIQDGKKSLWDILKLGIINLVVSLKYIFIAKKFDIIYINGPRLFPVFLILAKFSKKQFYFHLHIHNDKINNLIANNLNQKNIKIIVGSKFLYDKFKDQVKDNSKLDLLKQKLILVEGCLSPKFSTNQFQKRNQKGIKKVVTIGRISPDKGQQTIAEVSKHFPDIEFTIIGQSSKQDKKYENQIRQISGKNVVFVGSKDNHQTLSKEDWDLAIIPSKWEEPFGLTPLETMSSSILTITSNNGNFVNFKKDLGTITYSNLDELIQILNQLTTAKTSKLQEKAMEQYQQATQKYSYQIFQQKLKAAVLKPE